MRGRSRIAFISAAAFAAIHGASLLHAADLSWDPDPGTPGIQDGAGNWNTTDPNWFNGAANIAWSNAALNNAFFGTAAGVFNGATPTNNVTVNSAVTVQNINLGIGSNGAGYNILDDSGGGALTLAGNVDKTANDGVSQFALGNGLTLTSGQHVFKLHDTPGPAPELTIDNAIKGAGGVTLNNDTYDQWGTMVFTSGNNYSGGTNLVKGRLVITGGGQLGTGAVNISSAGVLNFYGANTTFAGDVTVSNPINITRSVYTGGGFDNYRAAIISENTGNPNSVMTFDGPFTIDSADARVQANTSKIVIASNIQQGSANPSTLTVDGDFAGTISLAGNNTALAGGIRLIGGVQLEATSQNNIGGPSSSLIFDGNATFRPVGGFMTNWGSHVLNTGSFSGGLFVDAGQTFTFDKDITGGGSIGKRGPGTLNMPMTYNLPGGQSFFDSGTVNFTGTGTSTLHSLHLRSANVNISSGTILTTNNYSSIGQDSNGTNGGPDNGTVSISGTGALVVGDADFNVSDNENTAGTINLSGNGRLTTNGIMWLAKGTNTHGVLNQSGGTFTVNRGGDFGFVIADGRFRQHPTGDYNFSGGWISSAGEVYVGEGNNAGQSGTGTWTQSGGTANVNNWFVVGREGGVGTVDLSGSAVFNKTGGGNFSMGDSSNPVNGVNMLTVRGNAALNSTSGQFFVGNNGGAVGIMKIQDNAQVNVNDWFAVGRDGGTGTVIMTGGTLNKTGDVNTRLVIGPNSTGTFLISGGTINSNSTWIAENGQGTLAISGTGLVNLGGFTGIRINAGAQGNLLMSGGTLNNSGTIDNAGNVTITGGVANLGVIQNANVTGQGSLNIGGTARATAVQVIQPNVTLTGTSTLTINVNGTASGTSKIGTLSIASPSRLDLTDNDLIQTNGTYTATSALISSARAGGLWNGSGLTSSSAASATPKNKTLGTLTGAQYHAAQGVAATFDGFAVVDTDVLVKFTYYGDADFNGVVNFDDYSRTDSGFNSHGTDWFHGDFDYNGHVDFDDYSLIDGAFNTQSGTLRRAMSYLDGSDRSDKGMDSPSLQLVMDHYQQFGQGYANSFLNAVPEPASAMVMMGVVASVATMRRRRRK